jgi:hypothetical protein
MKFETHNTNNSIQINGTGLLAQLRHLSYDRIIDVLGEPTTHFDNYKCDAEWILQFEDGVVATLYNYKNGQNYCGPKAPHVTEITTWNIGGYDREAANRVHQMLAPQEPLRQLMKGWVNMST